jgi:hypothetical protein
MKLQVAQKGFSKFFSLLILGLNLFALLGRFTKQIQILQHCQNIPVVFTRLLFLQDLQTFVIHQSSYCV